ncbi:conserved hypothetical protein [Culex quinquefasciatus]|uniref:Uncharacterized protein n=1 Tax=Culex quinquefasciatus TaxID=7176 RepID=B0WIG4_CULQU|nr:conserved hypothetical protein [Culex quinquefasciatus]|eukprot:XP_001848498.1 conserved hypothetical protein [Culex quinquefasciatus]
MLKFVEHNLTPDDDSRESEEICFVNTAPNDLRWSDFTQLALAQSVQSFHVQRLIASNDSEFATRVCSVIVSPLTEEESVQVIEGLFRNKALNRFAWIVLVSTDDSSTHETVHRYRDFVRRYNILNSLLVIHGDWYRHNLVLDQTKPILQKELIAQFKTKQSLQVKEYRKHIHSLSANESYLKFCDWAQMFVGSDQNIDPTTRQTLFYLIPGTASAILVSNVFLPSSIFNIEFKVIYDKLIESGIWNHWKQQERKDFKQPDQLQHLVLTFDDLISIWWILVWGAVLGGTALLLEIAASNRKGIIARITVLMVKILTDFKRIGAAVIVSVKAFVVNAVQRIWF